MALLTREDLANELGVSVRTIDGWRADGKGPLFVRYGKQIRYRRDDIDAWLQERTQTPGKDEEARPSN